MWRSIVRPCFVKYVVTKAGYVIPTMVLDNQMGITRSTCLTSSTCVTVHTRHGFGAFSNDVVREPIFVVNDLGFIAALSRNLQNDS
jgi:hypothetical protein